VSPISSNRLRTIRNLDIARVVEYVGLAATPRGRRRRFVCPLCRGCHTTLASKSNLARCFRCQTSFNPIDLVLAGGGHSFIEAVEYLESILCGS
jgi:hypothetical protein